MEWSLKSFNQLDTAELYEVMKLRIDVFVVEQNCPYHELDGKDRHPAVLHLSGRDEKNGKLAAYLRILPPGLGHKEAAFGRVVVADQYRKQGISNIMVKKSLKFIEKRWPRNDIRINAQVYLEKFYETHGFQSVSETYFEDGIEHVDMLRTPASHI